MSAAPTDAQPYNKATVWDTELASRDDALLDLRGVVPEYLLRDQFMKLRNTTVTLTVEWMVIPWVGSTTLERGASVTFHTPDEYFGVINV